MALSLDPVGMANLAVSTITAICAIYIAFLALRHTAKPRIDALMLNSDDRFGCNTEILFRFEIRNIGYWYAAAPAINVTVYCNFDPAFQPIEMRFGSSQSTIKKSVHIGKKGLKYIKAEGLKLSRRGEGEEVHVLARTPAYSGDFAIKVTAFSQDGATVTREFAVRCRS